MANSGRNRFEVDQDVGFQRKDWLFERIGWGFMLLVVVLAILGAFGHGAISRARAVAPDGSLRVEYGRFERHGAPTALTLYAARGGSADTTLSLWIDRSFLDGIRVDRVTPEPESQSAARGGTIYAIRSAAGLDTAKVVIEYTPDAIGSRTLRLGIAGRGAVTRPQFVYP